MRGVPTCNQPPGVITRMFCASSFPAQALTLWGEKPSNTRSATTRVTPHEMFGNWAPGCQRERRPGSPSPRVHHESYNVSSAQGQEKEPEK